MTDCPKCKENTLELYTPNKARPEVKVICNKCGAMFGLHEVGHLTKEDDTKDPEIKKPSPWAY